MKEQFDFNAEGVVLPEDYLKEICKEIIKSTRNYIIPKVLRYKGIMYSVYDSSTALSFNANVLTKGTLKVDVQDSLGSVSGKDIKRFEFTLSSSVLEKYMFRVLIFEHGFGGYPVNVVVEKGIAAEINGNENANYFYKCQKYEDFKKLIDKIADSKYIHNLLQGIITESLLVEKENGGSPLF